MEEVPSDASESESYFIPAHSTAEMPDAAVGAQEKRKRRRNFYRKRRNNDPPLPKLNMDAVPDYGEVAARLMAKMGFTAGMGLGKTGEGIREPVAVDAAQKKTGLWYVKKKRRRRRGRKKAIPAEPGSERDPIHDGVFL